MREHRPCARPSIVAVLVFTVILEVVYPVVVFGVDVRELSLGLDENLGP